MKILFKSKPLLIFILVLLIGTGSIGTYQAIQKANQRHTLSVVKGNMHNLQTFVETYAQDHDGTFPDNLKQLIAYAKTQNFALQDIYHPLSKENGLGQSMLDFKDYRPSPNQAFMVFYQAIDKDDKVQFYRIMGSDKQGELLTKYGTQKPIRSVKANMYTFQTMIETYGMDYQGEYPDTVASLYQAALQSKSPYWKRQGNIYQEPPINPSDSQALFALTNLPYEIQKEMFGKWYQHFGKWLMNASDYQPDPKAAGMVIYEPIKAAGKITKYRIYGTDKQGQKIKEKQQVFVLSNI